MKNKYINAKINVNLQNNNNIIKVMINYLKQIIVVNNNVQNLLNKICYYL